jgi:glutathione S-transferase
MKTQPQIADHWYPKDVKSRALVDEYLEYQHNGVRLPCAMYFATKFLMPIMSGKPPNEKKVNELQKQMEKSLDSLENIWLASGRDKEFLATKEISFADILAACELEQPMMAGYDTFKDRPRLTEWHKQVREETNPHYDEAHAGVNEIIETKGKGLRQRDMVFIYRYLRYVKFKRFFE